MSLDAITGRIRNMMARAVVSLINDAPGVQTVQLEVLDGEQHDQVERFQNYGLTSHPLPDAEAILLCVGGLRSHGIVIAVEDRRYRIKTEAGEVALYDDQGQVVHLKRDGMLIESPFKVTIEAPEVVVSADSVEVIADSVSVLSDSVSLGGAGGAAVARVGDTVAGGFITGGSTKVTAA